MKNKTKIEINLDKKSALPAIGIPDLQVGDIFQFRSEERSWQPELYIALAKKVEHGMEKVTAMELKHRHEAFFLSCAPAFFRVFKTLAVSDPVEDRCSVS